MRHMRAQGLYTGGLAPYGFALTDSGALVPVESRASDDQEGPRAPRRGRNSLARIAKVLAREGMVARNGKPFWPQQIRNMIQGDDEATEPSEAEAAAE